MDVHRNGASFVAILSHQEVQAVSAGSGILAAQIPEIAPAIAALTGIMTTMDSIGGNNGVEISAT